MAVIQNKRGPVYDTEHCMAPFTTTHVNVGGAAMSEQVELDEHAAITVVTRGAYVVSHLYICYMAACICVLATAKCMDL